MRCKVIKHAVDGVPVNGVVELVDNLANRALVEAGVIEPLEALPSRPPPKAPKGPSKSDMRDLDRMRAEFSEAWEGAQRRIAELEAENAALRAQLASKAPKGKKAEPVDAEKTEG